ncbi:MAG: STAS domain-containing protein [Candidatus Aminicenantales bacterium]
MVITMREQGNVAIFDIEGEIKRSDVTDITLHQAVKEKLDADLRNILLNFHKVDFIDSFGVGEILASYISTHNLGGKLKLAGISKKILVVFQVTMLTKVLEIFEDEAAALKSFQG